MTKENLFNEINKILLENTKPSEDLKRLIIEGKFNEEPFNQIKKLDNIKQNKKYHPEGSVLNHILLVVDQASIYKQYSKDKDVFMWSAFLHDIGKLTTTRVKKGRITSYDHDIVGETISLNILNKLTNKNEFKLKVSKLVRYHMQPLFYDKNLPFFKLESMLNETDYNEVALLSLCDRLGRGNLNIEKEIEEKLRIEKFKEYCNKNLK